MLFLLIEHPHLRSGEHHTSARWCSGQSAGIVYKTDAAISKKVRVAYEVPASDSPAISYPMAVVKEAKEPEAAKRFVKNIESDVAAAVFKKFGFIVQK